MCAEGAQLQVIAEENKIISSPTDMTGIHERTVIRLAVPDLPFLKSYFVHQPCVCNETIAIINRVISEVPRPTDQGKAMALLGYKAVIRSLPKTYAITTEQFLAMYSGAKRAKYTRAYEFVKQNRLTHRDARLTMFIKFEKLSPDKVNPDPRAIQFRDPRYCVAIAPFLKPIEAHLYQLHGDGSVLPPQRLIAKGLNQVERACVLKRKFDRFKRPVVIPLDASRFDKHVDAWFIALEHNVYKHCDSDPEFARLLAFQLRNIVRSRLGYLYLVKGRRMSGDMNTALGNCLDMIMMLAGYCLTYLQGKSWDIFDDGDDCLLLIEEEDLDLVRGTIVKSFLEFGQELKVERIARSFSTITFCQSSPIRYAPNQWKFVREPTKVMSCALMSNKWKTSTLGRRRLLATIGLGELILNLGVPMLQEFAMALIRNADGAKPYSASEFISFPVLREMKLFGMRTLREMQPAPICAEARLDFAEAFGHSIDYQHLVEQALAQWTINLDGDVKVASTWNPRTWIDEQCSRPERYL